MRDIPLTSPLLVTLNVPSSGDILLSYAVACKLVITNVIKAQKANRNIVLSPVLLSCSTGTKNTNLGASPLML